MIPVSPKVEFNELSSILAPPIYDEVVFMPKGTRSKAVARSNIEQAASFLQDLPKREKETLPISEAISGMADTVRTALAKGYSYNEISDMLSDKLGTSVSAWSLRRYVPAGTRKRSKSADAPKRGRKKKELTSTSGAVTPTPVVEPEPPSEPTPVRTRRATTRGKTAATAPATKAKAEPEAKPAAKTRPIRGKAAAKAPAAKPTRTTRKK